MLGKMADEACLRRNMWINNLKFFPNVWRRVVFAQTGRDALHSTLSYQTLSSGRGSWDERKQHWRYASLESRRLRGQSPEVMDTNPR